MIKVIEYTPNEKVLLEMQAIEKTRASLYELVDQTNSLDAYLTSFIFSVSGKEFGSSA